VRGGELQALLICRYALMESVDQPIMSVGPCRRRRFARRTHGGRFAGIFLILIAVFVSVADHFDPGVVAVCLGFACPALLDDLLSAVTVMDDGVRLDGFRLPRTLRYAEVAQAQLGENRFGVVVKTVDLIPNHGRRLRIITFQFTGFYGRDGWAAELIAAFQSHHVDAEPDLLKHLSHAASRSETSVREEQAALDERKQDPPISF
jgi:hypothetical protein